MDRPAPHDAAPSVPVSARANRTNGYEPPRIESLGTVDELTHGGLLPSPDIGPATGSAVSDRRLKGHITAVEPATALDGAATLAGRSA
jgi:hypothetical protein